MYILSSAVNNIRRYAGRYALFGVLLFVVLTVGTIALSASASLNAEIDAQIEKYGCTVRVTESGGKLTRDEIREIGRLSAVKEKYIYGFSFGVWCESLTFDGKPIDLAACKATAESRKAFTDAGLAMLLSGERQPMLFVRGEDFSSEEWTDEKAVAELLREGRVPERSGEILLTEGFAALFGLDGVGVGSKVTLKTKRITGEYTVVGLLAGNGKYEGRYTPIRIPMDDALAFDGTTNLIEYLTEGLQARSPTLKRVDVDAYILYDCYFILKSNNRFGGFQRKLGEVAAKISANTRDPNVKSPSFSASFIYPGAKELAKTYTSTTKITRFFLIAVVAISAAVILIMTIIGMHERRYEIGVLLAVGMAKWRIALLFVAENLVFMVGMAVLAYLVGLITAPAVAAGLLEGTVTVSRLAAALPVAGQMLALAAGLSLPASAISSLAILSFKPMTILRSRT